MHLNDFELTASEYSWGYVHNNKHTVNWITCVFLFSLQTFLSFWAHEQYYQWLSQMKSTSGILFQRSDVLPAMWERTQTADKAMIKLWCECSGYKCSHKSSEQFASWFFLVIPNLHSMQKHESTYYLRRLKEWNWLHGAIKWTFKKWSRLFVDCSD